MPQKNAGGGGGARRAQRSKRKVTAEVQWKQNGLLSRLMIDLVFPQLQILSRD